MKLNSLLEKLATLSIATPVFAADVYQNQITQNEILVVGDDLKVELEAENLNLRIVSLNDDRCRADLANFESPFVYADPFLVSSSKTCLVTDSGVEFISDSLEAPKDNYSISYAFQDEEFYYFAVNGRFFPEGTSGYLDLKVVAKDNSIEFYQPLFSGLIGYSGALSVSNGSLYLTGFAEDFSGNSIYEIPVEIIQENLEVSPLDFLGFVDQNSLRAINSEVFPGLSASLQTNGLEFAYYNNALWGDSYLVQRNDRVDFDLSLEELNRQCIVNEDSCHVFFVNETQNWVGVCVDSEGLISTPEEPLTQTDCQF